MKKDLAVIDTNVLVAALISQTSYPQKIFQDIIFNGKIKICLSVGVFVEYEDVLQRDRFKKYPDFINTALLLLNEIKKHSLWFDPKLTIDILDDKDDNKFIELAVEAHAGYIVTGNTDHFIIKEYQGISICSPKEFYDLLII